MSPALSGKGPSAGAASMLGASSSSSSVTPILGRPLASAQGATSSGARSNVGGTTSVDVDGRITGHDGPSASPVVLVPRTQKHKLASVPQKRRGRSEAAKMRNRPLVGDDLKAWQAASKAFYDTLPKPGHPEWHIGADRFTWSTYKQMWREQQRVAATFVAHPIDEDCAEGKRYYEVADADNGVYLLRIQPKYKQRQLNFKTGRQLQCRMILEAHVARARFILSRYRKKLKQRMSQEKRDEVKNEYDKRHGPYQGGRCEAEAVCAANRGRSGLPISDHPVPTDRWPSRL
ncbi:unnamed protein product [Amoebophrya sp. A25]|nr:unnamed protein product [Amoebophrya sp. A25]|eukprot:GSA25T00011520001.1